ncbi:oxysterols receptor LXR-alpha isoform X4 [Choloepus didactylus]|uniref:oxysterols receptor LXR-alpha isoform X4 n=1 Tax=Choloepus didactylus TaxID=27675 RepID=UPI00189DCD32|nr:oxysterols receptor LXR-alpha isoform X4 [Choloepus didactylus]
MSLWLEASVPDVSLDSAVELWEPEARDASSQALGGSNGTLREQARTPQSMGSTSGLGLEAMEPAALLLRAEAPRDSIGVLSEEQIRLKKLKRQEEEQAQAMSMPPRASSPPQVLPQLSPEQLGMIEKLVAAQQQCNRRSFSDRLRVTPWPMAPDPQSREARQQRFAHFTELAIVSVQEIVDFAKQLPGFLQLSREDQIALLKTSAIEVMLLETSRRYNPGSESITFLKDFSYNREDFAKAGLQVEFINPIFEFSRAMNELQLNDAEFALLIAISIFSAGPADVPTDANETGEPPYTEQRPLRAGVCTAPAGQKASPTALGDLGCARMIVLPYLLFSGLDWLRPGDCLLEREQTEKGKHSQGLGEGDPYGALKESQRAGSSVAAG